MGSDNGTSKTQQSLGSHSQPPIKQQEECKGASSITTMPVRRQMSNKIKSTQVGIRSRSNTNQTAKGTRQRARRPASSASSTSVNNNSQMSTTTAASSILNGHPERLSSNVELICFGCKRPIKDKFLLKACDKFWHDECLKCDRCQAKLGELGSSLYEKANMNLCRQDYFEMFGQKAVCAVCDKLIFASEMVMRARANVYHLECFACQLCGLRFCIGDRFYLCDNKIVCQYDYDEHIHPFQESMYIPQSENSSNYRLQSGTGSINDQIGSREELCLFPSLSNTSIPQQQEMPNEIACGYQQGVMFECNEVGSRPDKDFEDSIPISGEQEQRPTEGVELTVLGSKHNGLADTSDVERTTDHAESGPVDGGHREKSPFGELKND